MKRHAVWMLVGLAVVLHADVAGAHFLFIRIGTHAEAGRTVEVFFSERAVAGDPRFVPKIAATKLTVQTKPGEFRELKVRQGSDRLRAFLPAKGSVSVQGELVYGVLRRDVPFLLRHFPKAVAGDPKELAAMQPRDGTPLEIVAEWGGDAVTLLALRNGKPLPNAVFTTVNDELAGGELKADQNGRATWKPGGPGHYCIYTSSVAKQAGKYQGQSYSEIRDFATLSFRWPLVRTGADPPAVAMFEKALHSRAVWHDFPGFAADVTGTVDGRGFRGGVTVDADGAVTVHVDEETAADWVEDQLDSLVMHRLPLPTSDARPVLRFADDNADHPLGRLLVFDGGVFASSYRVRDGQISVVNRNLGSMNMTITVLDGQRNSDGKYLPHSYTVGYWNAEDGRLLRTDTIQDRWQRVGKFDLPTEHTVATSADSGLTVRTLRLTKHRLTPADKQ